uniref:Uncharacterized protein n=1 Tax=Davidia involucrata TaxID=16924 RepID=A0A5B6ZCW4_DAVIN
MAASATVPAFNISFFALQFHHRPLSSSSSSPTTKLIFYHQIFRSPRRHNGIGLLGCPPHAAISRQAQSTFDPELRSVLELATDTELYEIERILFGPSYFSPLLKSITKQADVDYLMINEDPEERDAFIEILESRFLFLAADARSTLRGWRPSYRNVLLGVRKKIKHTLFKQIVYRRPRSRDFSSSVAGLLKGGHLAAIKLESRAALLAAKQGVVGAASRYLGLRSMMALLGPVLWGTFLADVVIQMLGTDYARILRAIYAFAQIRITHTYR